MASSHFISLDNSFSKFTNLYSLSKTLRFELVPTENTTVMLENNNVFKKDQIIQVKYEKTKPFIDRLHREFIKEALSNYAVSGLQEYFEILRAGGKKANLDSAKKQLRKHVVDQFNATASLWVSRHKDVGFKGEGIELLFKEAVFKLLKEKYGTDMNALIEDNHGKQISIFDSWKGFTGYFDKFQQTRRNLYKDDGKEGRVATRIIDQNLTRFCDNIFVYEKIKDKVSFIDVEKSFGKTCSEVFIPDYYNTCLLQDGIDSYNEFIGGKPLENGEKVQGLNELINLYRQTTGDKVPYFKKLEKQILGEKDEVFIDEITDEDFVPRVLAFYRTVDAKYKLFLKLLDDFVTNQDVYELSQIYISKKGLQEKLYRWLTPSAREVYDEELFEVLKKAKKVNNKDKQKVSGYVPDFVEVLYIKQALENIDAKLIWSDRYYSDGENEGIIDKGFSSWKQFLVILNHEYRQLLSFEDHVIIDKELDFDKEVKQLTDTVEIVSQDKNARTVTYRGGYDVYKAKLAELGQSFEKDTCTKKVIKNFADSVLSMYHFAMMFAVWDDTYPLDVFYTNNEFGYLLYYEDAYKNIVQEYNKLRNYLTKKPYSTEKWKLNFENPTLAAGFDKNKESDNSTVILRQGDKYFLGVMKKGFNKIFDNSQISQTGNSPEAYFEKMVYKYTKDVVTGIPKSSTQVKEVQEHFRNSDEDFFLEECSSVGNFIVPLKITKEIFDLNNKVYAKEDISQAMYRWALNTDEEKNYVKSFQKSYLSLGGSPELYCKSVTLWIGFCLNFLKSYPSAAYFDYSQLRQASDYESVDECYQELNNAGYTILFQNVSEKYVRVKNKNGELYLFQIKNKDWNEGSTGKKNLHTLYFESLFSKENAKQGFPFKLSGNAELFFRPGSIEQTYERRNFPREIPLKRRYSKDGIFFHIPVQVNRTKVGSPNQFNKEVNDFLAGNPNINIIGVDRGEKHLVYYSVISQNGEKIDGGSFNEINGQDYHDKLEKRAKEREQQRRDWETVEGIKDLKKGYISQVVKKLADLAIEHNAIIVMEDLNMRFKQIRGGIEKSVYQQLEKALIDKLSFLVNKGEVDPQKAGHLLKAYQLTAPIDAFKDMGKQTGIMFYTQAAYTSKIDPVTGWRPHLYLKYSSVEKAKDDISRFTKIAYKNDRFEFTYNITDFRTQKEWPLKTEWTVCSCVERFRWNKKLANGKGDYEHYPNVTDDFKKLFDSVGINYLQENIKSQVVNLDENTNVEFFREFIKLFALVCQIRNTNSEEAGNLNDFILSPVEPFFDSRSAEDFGKGLPSNGDENGAYNIARKGMIILNTLSTFKNDHGSCEGLSWGDLYISDTQWDDFAQSFHG